MESPEIELFKYSQLIFNRGAETIQWRKNNFPTDGAGTI